MASFIPARLSVAILAGVLLLSVQLGAAPLASHAPALSVHETNYGTAIHDGRKESIEGLEIHLVSYSTPGTNYEVQCFFLKKGKGGHPATIDDTLIFEVTNPHGSYGVLAKPIKIGKDNSSGVQSSKSGKSSKGSKSQTSPNPSVDFPREGYVVRVLSDGVVLRQRCSTHRVEEFVKENADLLDQAAVKKSARHLQASDLLKR